MANKEASGARSVWWLFFTLWLMGTAAAIAIPVARDDGLGGFFLLLSLHLFVLGILGMPVFIHTVMEWGRLRRWQRFVGFVPLIYGVAPFIAGPLLYSGS